MIQGPQIKAIDVVNSLEFWMTQTTLGGQLRALGAMNNLRQ